MKLSGLVAVIVCCVPSILGDLGIDEWMERAAHSYVPQWGVRGNRVLYIGDSLSVGPFGDSLEKTLLSEMGGDHVWFYASCGSSVHSWLASEPVFVTPCGYRETVPGSKVLEDFHQGQKPKGMPTPKIEQLLADIQPDVVIVQLGTNHFDTLELGGTAVMPAQTRIFERFAKAIHQYGSHVKTVVWIAPPDCARFPAWITDAVWTLIRKTASAHEFQVIDSRRYTHYVKGVTGGDGVHYKQVAASKWANHVIAELHTMLSPLRH